VYATDESFISTVSIKNFKQLHSINCVTQEDADLLDRSAIAFKIWAYPCFKKGEDIEKRKAKINSENLDDYRLDDPRLSTKFRNRLEKRL